MICPLCGQENPDKAKFCYECGTALHPSQPSPASAPDPAKTVFTPEPERKVVTALFSDLNGYTAMTEKLDPEQVKEITGLVFGGVKEIVAKYEGFIDRLLGDGVLAFFGIPKAHEDDPVRALRAALEIHEFVKGLSPRYEDRFGAPLSMHSGINTGLVVTAEEDPEGAAFGRLDRTIRSIHPEEAEEILPFVATLMGMKLKGKYAERVQGIEGEALEKLIFKNLRELLIKGSEWVPQVIAMEDLHWADTSSLLLLQALFTLAEKQWSVRRISTSPDHSMF